jgi:antitoxin component HigA of HigAB toxin-antitoxin module
MRHFVPVPRFFASNLMFNPRMKRGVGLMENFFVEFMQEDPDILAKSRFDIDGIDYEVTIITAAAGSLNNRYLPEIIQVDDTNLIVAFDGEHFERKINESVQQAQEELEEIGNTQDYPNHIGSAAAAVMSLYLNRALTSVKQHLKHRSTEHHEFFWENETEE